MSGKFERNSVNITVNALYLGKSFKKMYITKNVDTTKKINIQYINIDVVPEPRNFRLGRDGGTHGSKSRRNIGISNELVVAMIVCKAISDKKALHELFIYLSLCAT